MASLNRVSTSNLVPHVLFGQIAIGILNDDDYLLGNIRKQIADGSNSRFVEV